MSNQQRLRARLLEFLKFRVLAAQEEFFTPWQSKAGIENLEYQAQRRLLKKVDAGDISVDEFRAEAAELLRQEIDGATDKKPAASQKSPVSRPN